MAKLAGSLALEVTEKETAGSPLASNIPCWILSQCLNKKSSLLELRKDAMSLSLDCSVAEIVFFKSLWDHILDDCFLPSSLYQPSGDPINQFEKSSPPEKLHLVWYYIVKISQSYTMCPELLYQQSYFDDLSRIIAILLLIAPSKKQFQKIISCLIISPLSSDILMMLIDKYWIPLEDLIDGLAAIMMDSRPVQHEIELSRSPSLVKGNENLPDIADLSGTFWDQLISLNSLENKSKAVLRSTATTMINSLLQKCNQSQLLIFRSKMSFYKLLPSLCLKITREKLFDMWVYLDSMLDTTIQSLTGYSEGAVPLAIARLDEHWFFSSLTPTIVSELLSSLFLDLRGCLQRAGGEVDETRNLYTLVRLICALFSSTSNIHKVPCPSSADVVGISADFDWIKDHVIQTLHCLQSLPPPVQATFPFLFRLSTSLVFVYIISSRRQNPSTQVTDHMDLLSKYDQLRETFHCPDRDHKVYCQYLTLCFSLDKIGFLRDACSREISLERFIDFLPQTSFLYLSNIIRNFSQNRGESALFGSTKEKLLTEFVSIPMPSSISGHTEFPGDYLSSLSLILKTRLILLATPSTANFQLLVGKFRMIFLHILQNVSWPPHSSLQDVVDNWIEISIDGGDGWQDNLHQQSHHPPLEKNGNVISMTLFSSEIIELVSGLLTDLKTSSVKISSCPPITGSGDWHEQFVGTFLSSLSPDQGPREPNSQRRAEAFSLQNISPLIQDSELLSKANLYTACPLDISISQCHMRAAIACYLSLKYQSVCSLSSRTQYTCIFSTDPRELPLRGALIIFLHSALWESYIRVRGSTSSHYHKSYSFSDCSHDFFSGFTRFVRLQCSELLIRERSITLLQSPLVSRLVTSSLLATTKEVDVDVIFNFSLQSLLSTHSTVAKVLPPYFHLGPAKMTQITTRLLRVLLHPSFPQNSSATHQSRSPNSSFAPLPNNSSECEMIFHKLWCFWRAIHSIHLMPAQYELAAVNLLLELSESHHPHAICSYSTLVKEPLILFRLPIIWFSHITSANMIFYIFRSVTIASRITCHEAYRVNKSVSKHILSHRLLPKSMTLHKETIASPHITSVPVVARDGSSRLENCDSIDENDFLNLQELMGIRLICEIWTYISQLSRENETTEVVWMQSRLPERVFHAFRSSVSLILRENSALLESLLHYGITSFSSFYLLASGNPTILNLFIDKVNGAISNHTEPYMVAASKSMEQILLHLQYLFICLMEPITTSFRYVLPVQEHIDLTLHAHQTITLFASFLKKSLKFHCWKQQDTANPTLGKELLKCLSIMSSSFPVLTLKMISTCTSQELFASGSSSSPALFSLTSVLGRLQPALLLLQQSILRKIGTISEGVKRTTSDFEDEDMPQEKRVRLGL